MSEPDIADDEAEFQAGLDEIFHAAHRKSVRVLASAADLSSAVARAEAAEARLAVALEALEPFAEAAEHLHPSSPDDGLTLDGVEVRHWRQAWWTFNNGAAQALGRGDGRE